MDDVDLGNLYILDYLPEEFAGSRKLEIQLEVWCE